MFRTFETHLNKLYKTFSADWLAVTLKQKCLYIYICDVKTEHYSVAVRS